ncbi:Serine/threonine-protein kinase AfsK [Streptomyces sp. YIM 130001]|uniref:serine/threonine-protein kinase n=1 Tax=Streptomyces sp. YIM 130001 TaxID=2259644 RepID=UPI000E648E92|nr:serine/threonine-protein kinase [Streptomyces sp. YIM 130001]RII19562.1 Serine/threonine-protein kinase AfsK [Streptomyces sp. YIM 130001]
MTGATEEGGGGAGSSAGSSIGGYRLIRKLGSGGMGDVHLARSPGGRTVAVKVIKAELAAEPEFRERFRQEVAAARRVGERWTAPVLDADTEADTPWVATGYVAGPSLDHVVSASGHGPLPEISVRTLAYGLAGALLDIHGAGLVHRDLKPSNVLVTIDGPRVIDFGIARALDAVPESTLTRTGMVVGSPSFMSPEQVKGDQLGPAGDVFCMGAVLMFAATGRTPFGGGGSGGLHAVMFRIAEEEPDLVGIGEPLRTLIARCLSKDPADRPTPEEIVQEVQPVATATSSPPWLPARLIAELGRSAVKLLDTDTPPRATQATTAQSGPVPAAYSPEAGTAVLPQTVLPHGGPSGTTGPSGTAYGDDDFGRPEPPRRRGRLLKVTAGTAAVVAAAVLGTAAAGLGPFADDAGGAGTASDVPAELVGTWAGEVERDGQPTGQYRRFVISKGQLGEVVATSISLGRTYACTSDGKLAGKGGEDGTRSVRLDTKVVRSIPDDKCSALGEHTLSPGDGDAIRWSAAGRTAELRRVDKPERLPDEVIGTWERPLPGGGTQSMTVRQKAVGSAAAELVSDSGSLHCEAGMVLVSAGGAAGPIRVTPPDVDSSASSGDCATGDSSTLRAEGGELVREFPGGEVLRYTPA